MPTIMQAVFASKFNNMGEIAMTNDEPPAGWITGVILLGRLVLTLVFLMAFVVKLTMFGMIATTISSAGFPFPSLLAAAAALFELALVLALVTGAYFSEMMLLGAIYVVFLAFAFHGPAHWTDPKGLELGSFINHFPFAAGMLFAAAVGPGRMLAIKIGRLRGRPIVTSWQ